MLETCCASFGLLQGRALLVEKGQAQVAEPLCRHHEAGGRLAVIIASDMLATLWREAVAAILASISWKAQGILGEGCSFTCTEKKARFVYGIMRYG